MQYSVHNRNTVRYGVYDNTYDKQYIKINDGRKKQVHDMTYIHFTYVLHAQAHPQYLFNWNFCPFFASPFFGRQQWERKAIHLIHLFCSVPSPARITSTSTVQCTTVRTPNSVQVGRKLIGNRTHASPSWDYFKRRLNEIYCTVVTRDWVIFAFYNKKAPMRCTKLAS